MDGWQPHLSWINWVGAKVSTSTGKSKLSGSGWNVANGEKGGRGPWQDRLETLNRGEDSTVDQEYTRVLPTFLPNPLGHRCYDVMPHWKATRFNSLPIDLPQHHQTPSHKQNNQTRYKAGHHEGNWEIVRHGPLKPPPWEQMLVENRHIGITEQQDWQPEILVVRNLGDQNSGMQSTEAIWW